MRTISQVIRQLPHPSLIPRLDAPAFGQGKDGPKVMLAVESHRRHMTDEAWQMCRGLNDPAGWILEGNNLGYGGNGKGCSRGLTDVSKVLELHDPSVVLVQDKREWDRFQRGCKDRDAHFRNVEALRTRDDVFKLTILKDAHQRPDYHRQSAEEMGVHAWIVYYHPDIVCHLAPYLRREHLIRTWHSVDVDAVPTFSKKTDKGEDRSGCLLSGAVSGCYPLRRRMFDWCSALPETYSLKHPGYHADGCHTPEFLRILSRFKVAVCTSSVYGYALRKIVEATACGCSVLTDLPSDDVMPEIDGNLTRISSDATLPMIQKVIKRMLDRWDPEKQEQWAAKARTWYDHRAIALRLHAAIGRMATSRRETAG